MFIDANRDDVVAGRRLGVELICSVLQVAPSSYYAIKNRDPSVRDRRDEVIGPVVRQLWEDNYRSTVRGRSGRRLDVAVMTSAETR